MGCKMIKDYFSDFSVDTVGSFSFVQLKQSGSQTSLFDLTANSSEM